ncbi:XAC2610-related protein [Chryseobacterium sp. SIMBA_029]|uniref:XAC2610-related protein n=1 Tax=Chryseobacterium sp. SIMBA_029 TaxID=3085772 RepID=UPI00397D28B0
MMNYRFLLPFMLLGTIVWGQNHFELKDASRNYDVSIDVQNCEKDECSGKAVIDLRDKKTSNIFQTLTSEDLNFYLKEDQKPTVNIIQLYDEQSPLIFNDFNFDGTEDIAIRNGNESSYGGPSYDVYVFNSTKKRFVMSEELTSLAYENLGMFQTDSERKRIVTYAKSGCCWHLTTEYAVVPKKGLVKVYELEEDAMGGDETVKVTKRELKNNKWVAKSTKYPIKEYYKE